VEKRKEEWREVEGGVVNLMRGGGSREAKGGVSEVRGGERDIVLEKKE